MKYKVGDLISWLSRPSNTTSIYEVLEVTPPTYTLKLVSSGHPESPFIGLIWRGQVISDYAEVTLYKAATHIIKII